MVLPASITTPFALLLHELGTNALKYGALSVEGGTVGLTWRLHPHPQHPVLEINWVEEGGPEPKTSLKPGLGSYLIENGLPQAKVTRDIRPSGMAYRIELSLGNEPVRM